MKRVRAVAVVLRGDEVLLMFRRKDGHEYWTFPGGGVEAGESPEQAVVRELAEETTVAVTVDRLLYHHVYDDGSEQCFYLCRYVSGEPALAADSVEAERMEDGNYYDPGWVGVADFPRLLIYPLEIRDWFLEDLKSNFSSCPRGAAIELAELRHQL